MMHVMAAGMAGDRDPECVISDGTTVITIVTRGESTATKNEDSVASVRLEGLPTNPIIYSVVESRLCSLWDRELVHSNVCPRNAFVDKYAERWVNWTRSRFQVKS